jgi:DNA-binding NarL/FixJ family response regulator
MYISPLIAPRVLDSYHNHVTDHECRYNNLTNFEQQVFRLWVEGHPLYEIAEQTACTEAVVIGTQKRISEKIQIHDTTTMIRYAEYIGIISPASRDIPTLHS